MSNLSIVLMRKLISAVDSQQIPESFLKRYQVETESDIQQLLADWTSITGKADNANSDQLDADIKNWAAGN
ncbi:MAG: hypothetical protein M1445_09670 [Bacteroidetes bacterium]|nr:hypothetical protein [Bacteroidota bacterium]